MDKFKVNETLLVGVDFTNGEDVGVLLVSLDSYFELQPQNKIGEWM